MERNRFSEKSTLTGELITAFSSYWEYVYLTFSGRQRLQHFRWNYGLNRGPFFSPPDIRRKRVKSRMIYTGHRVHSAGPTLIVTVLRAVYPVYIPANQPDVSRRWWRSHHRRERHPKNITLRYQTRMP